MKTAANASKIKFHPVFHNFDISHSLFFSCRFPAKQPRPTGSLQKERSKAWKAQSSHSRGRPRCWHATCPLVGDG